MQTITRSDKKVLLLEADQALTAAYESFLREMDPDIKFDTVTRGEDALGKISRAHREREKKPYDLIVINSLLSGKVSGVDFWEICQYVYPNIPALITSTPDDLRDMKLIPEFS